MAIWSLYNGMHQPALYDIGHAGSDVPYEQHDSLEVKKYKNLLDESIAEMKAVSKSMQKSLLAGDSIEAKYMLAGNSNEAKAASSTTGAPVLETNANANVDVDIFLKDVYKYEPPSDISQKQQQDGADEYCGSGPDFQKFFSMPSIKARSRLNEDKIIYETFFKNNKDDHVEGTYIELGAFDGLREANTHFFDKCLGWKGLLLEGNPRKYDNLLTNRPNAHRMNFAPSCVQWNDTVAFYSTIFTNAGLPGMAKAYDGKEEVPKMIVPCGPIGPVIEKIFPGQLQLPSRVNFFSLDVEGAEKMVLDTIDFSKVQIDVFMIEVVNNHCLKDKECEVRNQIRNKMVKELGYEKHEGIVPNSDIYIHPNYKNNPFKRTK